MWASSGARVRPRWYIDFPSVIKLSFRSLVSSLSSCLKVG